MFESHRLEPAQGYEYNALKIELARRAIVRAPGQAAAGTLQSQDRRTDPLRSAAMLTAETHVGAPRSRVDGRAKVTGAAKYAAEFKAQDLAHGVVISSAIAKGRIKVDRCLGGAPVPGVLQVFTHENRPRTAWFDFKHRDDVAPPGSPFRPLS